VVIRVNLRALATLIWWDRQGSKGFEQACQRRPL
jgi:hypothetical protein